MLFIMKILLWIIILISPVFLYANESQNFKDLWNGFRIFQDTQKTELYFKKHKLKIFNHLDFNLSPIYGGYEYTCPETGRLSVMWKRKDDDTYNSLLYVEQYDACRREYLRDRMKIMTTKNPRFFILTYSEYDTWFTHIIDTKTNIISDRFSDLDYDSVQIESLRGSTLFIFNTLKWFCNKSVYFLSTNHYFIDQSNLCLEDDYYTYSIIKKVSIYKLNKIFIEYEIYSKKTNSIIWTSERKITIKTK